MDVVLDSAAGGWNTVEREGVSITHPAKFIMIGSGNPGEGEMRPQMLDRFGMAVNVFTVMDSDLRVKLVQDRLQYAHPSRTQTDSVSSSLSSWEVVVAGNLTDAPPSCRFEKDPFKFAAECQAEVDAMKAKIVAAREQLKSVKMDRELKLKISEVCSMINVDGLRGDIVTNRAARALVAWEGRDEVTANDIQRVIIPCLSHRLRKDPTDTMDGGSIVAMAFNRVFNGSGFDYKKLESNNPKAKEAAAKKAAEEAKAKEEAEKPKPGAWKPGAWKPSR